MGTLVSACEIYNCNSCDYCSGGICIGCVDGNDKLRESGEDICAVLACTQSKGIKTCGECKESSCALRRGVEEICPLRSKFEKRRWWAGRMFRVLENRNKDNAIESDEKVSEKVIKRLRWYLMILDSFASEGVEAISSWQIAEKVGINAALIRKDLSRFGEFGTPSYGYRIDLLSEKIRGILHLDKQRGLVWVGASSLRYSVNSLDRLCSNNCSLKAVFDTDEAQFGRKIGNLEVQPVSKIRELLNNINVSIAVIAISGAIAKEVAIALTDMGVNAILNMSGESLVLPDHVRVHNMDLVGELLELCYYSK